MWVDLDTPETAIVGDARARIEAFIDEARLHWAYAAFVAEMAGRSVASAGCQLYQAPYPDILEPSYRRYGYLWAVYVEPEARRLGVASQLTAAALEHLRGLGCQRAILNASPPGRPLYQKLGFEISNEMRIDLS